MEEASCQNILKLLFGVTLPFQKHLCESGQLVLVAEDDIFQYILLINSEITNYMWGNYERN